MIRIIVIFAVFIFFSLISSLVFNPVFAQVVINEFSVEPSDKYDWIEIYSPEIIDISNWKVGDEAGDFFTIPEGTSLGSNIYYIVSKYQRLNNDKDTIYLYDQNGNEKDSIKYGYEGEACLPSTDGSIARIPDGNSTYDRLLNHTKGQTNGLLVTDSCPVPTPTPTPTPRPTNIPTPTPTPTSKPTPIPTPTPKLPSPTPKPSSPTPKMPTATPSVSASNENYESLVLSASSVSELTVTPALTPTENMSQVLGESTNKPNNFLPFIFIGLGAILVVTSGAFLLMPKFKRYNKTYESGETD